jgi:farnesyl diphosphate synthase
MDNSDLRRGKPTCHKAFNEAFAILAGDGLQTLAFEVLATHPADLTPLQRIQMVKVLAQASGFQGMAAGQALDLEKTNHLLEMYSLKTGALLVACVQLASIAAHAEPPIANALESYAFHLGLAYQLQDDLLDDEPQAITGKSSGLDVINEKKTYSTLHGKEKTHAKIAELYQQALESLSLLGTSSEMLRDFAHTLLQRKK